MCSRPVNKGRGNHGEVRAEDICATADIGDLNQQFAVNVVAKAKGAEVVKRRLAIEAKHLNHAATRVHVGHPIGEKSAHNIAPSKLWC